jgi:hypothetical protein
MNKQYLCWSDYPVIDGIEVFEVWNQPVKDNHYDMNTVYCPICGDNTNLIFRNYETKLKYSFEGYHSYCTKCKGCYDAHEIIHTT